MIGSGAWISPPPANNATPTASGTVTVDIATGAAQDAARNPTAAAADAGPGSAAGRRDWARPAVDDPWRAPADGEDVARYRPMAARGRSPERPPAIFTAHLAADASVRSAARERAHSAARLERRGGRTFHPPSPSRRERPTRFAAPYRQPARRAALAKLQGGGDEIEGSAAGTELTTKSATLAASKDGRLGSRRRVDDGPRAPAECLPGPPRPWSGAQPGNAPPWGVAAHRNPHHLRRVVLRQPTLRRPRSGREGEGDAVLHEPPVSRRPPPAARRQRFEGDLAYLAGAAGKGRGRARGRRLRHSVSGVTVAELQTHLVPRP